MHLSKVIQRCHPELDSGSITELAGNDILCQIYMDSELNSE